MFPFLLPLLFGQEQSDRLVLEGASGPGKGKHVVLLAGDEEYRSEEMLPQLAKILSTRHGFKCTVLFSIGKDGTIDPERRDHQPGLEALKSADLVVLMLRFRQWPEEQMRHFDDYLKSGKPILALRTSTHAFDFDSGPFERYGWRSKGAPQRSAGVPPACGQGVSPWPGGFGRQVLGETWVSHWGDHGKQATRAVPDPKSKNHPVLKGVNEIFVPTDVYEAHPRGPIEVLMLGQVVSGMSASDPAAAGRKQTVAGLEQPVNDPMMPVVWAGFHSYEAPDNPNFHPLRFGRALTTTMGSAQDLLNEGFRRLLVNGVYWLTGLPVPAKAKVGLVGPYKPSPFGFGGFKKGVRPDDAIGKN